MIEKILMKDVISPLIIVLIGIIVYIISKRIIKNVFKFKFIGADEKRQKTIMLLFTNIVKFFIIAIVFVSILEVYGFDTKSLLASLGVFAAVIALALQDLLKDFVAGISIMLEGQFRIGDTVTIGAFKGEVIALTLKSTRIKAYTGEIKIFTNRNITEVVNHTLDYSLAIVDINIDYNADIEKTEKVLNKLCDRLSNEIKFLTGPVQLLGINEITNYSIVYRITADTESMKQFEIQRKILREAKLELDKNNIIIPYSQMVVYNGK
ncbi:MAG: mechanosensitive ion channel family protein [Bacilli bacterium]